MRKRSLIDLVRGNRASSVTVMVTVGVSSLLLSLLGCVLYNFWADAAARTAAEGASLAERFGGELLVTALLYLVVLMLACLALVLIIRNAFLASMQNRLHQLGLLATVGATPRQIGSLLLREALFLSVIPALVGIALGTLIAALFVDSAIGFGQQVGVDGAGSLVFRYHLLLLVVTIALVLLTVVVSAGLPARKLAKTGPLVAIAGAPEAAPSRRERRSLLARTFGIEGELAYGSLRQRKVALRSTSLAIGLSFLVLGIFLSFMTVSNASVEQTYYERYGIAWDIVVDVPNVTAEDMEGIAHDLEGVAETVVVDDSDAGMRLYLEAASNGAQPLEAAVEEALLASGYEDHRVVDMVTDRARSEAIWAGYAAVVGGFCGILALIGIAGIVTQAVGSIHQRKREFARLRSIGMTPGGIFKMLGIEGLMTTLRPLVATLPLIAVAALALAFLGRQPLASFLAAFPYGALLTYVGIVLVVIVGANAFGAARLARADLAETLKDDTLV